MSDRVVVVRHHRRMLVVMNHRGGPDVRVELEAAAAAFAARPGCLRVWVARAPDDPGEWLLLSEWADAGSMRRGLGSWEAKVALGPLQASAAPGGVYEPLVVLAGADRDSRTSDRALDADIAGPSR